METSNKMSETKKDFKLRETTGHDKKGKVIKIWYFSYKEKSPKGWFARISNNYQSEKKAILEMNKLKTK